MYLNQWTGPDPLEQYQAAASNRRAPHPLATHSATALPDARASRRAGATAAPRHQRPLPRARGAVFALSLSLRLYKGEKSPAKILFAISFARKVEQAVTDEKKDELFQNGLRMHLQDHLVIFPDLSNNALASATIDQEGII
jgi:hypothetical protein